MILWLGDLVRLQADPELRFYPLVTHRFSLDEIEEADATAAAKSGGGPPPPCSTTAHRTMSASDTAGATGCACATPACCASRLSARCYVFGHCRCPERQSEVTVSQDHEGGSSPTQPNRRLGVA
jgi:hypothetical protein